MSRLSLFLPPFAADYSGAAAVLFSFDCMVVILDAGCCTRSYAEYDEPRWKKRRKASFSAQLRTLDTIVGDEAATVAQIVREAQSLKPQSIALIGTPVPAVVAMDIDGMALDVEASCGVPCFGIETNGFDTYERGISDALCKIFDRFAQSDDVPRDVAALDGALTVNMLGITPLDMPDGKAFERWKEYLLHEGIQVTFDGMSPFGCADIAALSSADASIVASWGGLALARVLKERYDVPFVCGVPFDDNAASSIKDEICAALYERREARVVDTVATDSAKHVDVEPRILLVGDQVFMNEMRKALVRHSGGTLLLSDIVVMSFFALDKDLSLEGDCFLAEDIDLENYLREHQTCVVVGDLLLKRVLSVQKSLFVAINHPAVSGFYPSDPERSVQEIVDEIQLRVGT